MKVFLIYRHTCTVNQKSYIGLTSKTIETRWNEHCSDARNGSRLAFHCAIRKYGEEAWHHETLEVHETFEAACAAEVRLIAEHRTFLHEATSVGYNMTRGGDGVCDVVIPPESYMRVSRALMGNQHTAGRVRPIAERERIAHSHRLLTIDDVQRIINLRAAGSSYEELMSTFGCSYPTLRRVLRGVYFRSKS